MLLEEIVIDPEWVELSKEKALKMGTLKNSITHGRGNVAGFLGEYIVQSFLGESNCEIVNTYDYDLLLKNPEPEKGHLRLEVKTKLCNTSPKTGYECSVADYNTKQDCDVYVFVRVLAGLKKAWICGWKPKGEFFKQARQVKKGELDPTNNFIAQCDCHNLPVNKLCDIKDLTFALNL